MEQVLMQAKGVTGKLVLLETKVRITRRSGILALVTQGLRSDKEIAIKDISSIELKKAGTFNGYIELIIEGGEAKKGLFDAALDENTVTFRARHQPAFEKIKVAIEEKIASIRQGEIRLSNPNLPGFE
jgi:hypothetical protein